jgi:hypothetical protein
MWKVMVDKEPKDKAKEQISFRYGHLPFGKPFMLTGISRNGSIRIACEGGAAEGMRLIRS